MNDDFSPPFDLGADGAGLDAETRALLRDATPGSDEQGQRLAKLENQVATLSLMTEALWNLLTKRTKLTDEDLTASLQEVTQKRKARDETKLTCTKCKMQNSVHQKKCIYCGGELIGHAARNLFNV